MFRTVLRMHTHVKCVRKALQKVKDELTKRGDCHDDSKFQQDELEYYSAYEKLPQGLEFGSDEYKAALKELNIGVGTQGFSLHSSRNDHHPEYYENVSDMPLFAVIEMVCDWRGAHDAYGNSGDWFEGVEYNVSDTPLKRGCLCEAHAERSLHKIKS